MGIVKPFYENSTSSLSVSQSNLCSD